MLTEKVKYKISMSFDSIILEDDKYKNNLSINIYLLEDNTDKRDRQGNRLRYGTNIGSISSNKYEECCKDIAIKFNKWMNSKYEEEKDYTEYLLNNKTLIEKFNRFMNCSPISIKTIYQDILESNYAK